VHLLMPDAFHYPKAKQAMPKLSKTELMALDLMIQVMKDELQGVEVNVEAFIGGIVKITKKVINVTKRITPVVKVATVLTPAVVGGTISRTAQLSQSTEESIEPDISLDTLIALRNALSREEEE
jgi:hypothetical protein